MLECLILLMARGLIKLVGDLWTTLLIMKACASLLVRKTGVLGRLLSSLMS